MRKHKKKNAHLSFSSKLKINVPEWYMNIVYLRITVDNLSRLKNNFEQNLIYVQLHTTYYKLN